MSIYDPQKHSYDAISVMFLMKELILSVVKMGIKLETPLRRHGWLLLPFEGRSEAKQWSSLVHLERLHAGCHANVAW